MFGGLREALAKLLKIPGRGSPLPQHRRILDDPLDPAPIPTPHVLGGAPTARSKRLTASHDGAFNAFAWACTPGKFRWVYHSDEIIYILAGHARVAPDQGGAPIELRAGDVVHFRRETSAVWEIFEEIRKVAVLREDPPDLLARMHSSLGRVQTSGQDAGEA